MACRAPQKARMAGTATLTAVPAGSARVTVAPETVNCWCRGRLSPSHSMLYGVVFVLVLARSDRSVTSPADGVTVVATLVVHVVGSVVPRTHTRPRSRPAAEWNRAEYVAETAPTDGNVTSCAVTDPPDTCSTATVTVPPEP